MTSLLYKLHTRKSCIFKGFLFTYYRHSCLTWMNYQICFFHIRELVWKSMAQKCAPLIRNIPCLLLFNVALKSFTQINLVFSFLTWHSNCLKGLFFTQYFLSCIPLFYRMFYLTEELAQRKTFSQKQVLDISKQLRTIHEKRPKSDFCDFQMRFVASQRKITHKSRRPFL